MIHVFSASGKKQMCGSADVATDNCN